MGLGVRCATIARQSSPGSSGSQRLLPLLARAALPERAAPPERNRANRLHRSKSGSIGGRGGIRTPETAQRRLTVFKTAAFNRSATLPGLLGCYALSGSKLASRLQGEVAEWLKALAC